MAYLLSYICKILTIKLFYGRSNESRLPIEMPWGTFQSTHPRGVWPRWLGRETSLRSFNPRTYERCDSFRSILKPHPACFNPRTYERCDEPPPPMYPPPVVSIHAPTRGATSAPMPVWFIRAVSIHAPTRGATPDCLKKNSMRRCFNPRTYERCD